MKGVCILGANLTLFCAFIISDVFTNTTNTLLLAIFFILSAIAFGQGGTK